MPTVGMFLKEHLIYRETGDNPVPEDAKECPICQEEYESPDANIPYERAQIVTNIPGCNHVFGEECIKKWIAESRGTTCPLCRTQWIDEPAWRPQQWAPEIFMPSVSINTASNPFNFAPRIHHTRTPAFIGPPPFLTREDPSSPPAPRRGEPPNAPFIGRATLNGLFPSSFMTGRHGSALHTRPPVSAPPPMLSAAVPAFEQHHNATERSDSLFRPDRPPNGQLPHTALPTTEQRDGVLERSNSLFRRDRPLTDREQEMWAREYARLRRESEERVVRQHRQELAATIQGYNALLHGSPPVDGDLHSVNLNRYRGGSRRHRRGAGR